MKHMNKLFMKCVKGISHKLTNLELKLEMAPHRFKQQETDTYRSSK
jgi:hypothetical protein